MLLCIACNGLCFLYVWENIGSKSACVCVFEHANRLLVRCSLTSSGPVIFQRKQWHGDGDGSTNIGSKSNNSLTIGHWNYISCPILVPSVYLVRTSFSWKLLIRALIIMIAFRWIVSSPFYASSLDIYSGSQPFAFFYRFLTKTRLIWRFKNIRMCDYIYQLIVTWINHESLTHTTCL